MTNSNIKPMSIGLFLKTSTAGLHREVEGKLSRILFHRDLNAQTYYQVLLCMHNAYKEMEQAVNNYPVSQKVYVNRSKLRWLENDIAHLKPLIKQVEGKHLSKVTLNLSSSAQAMGLLYVIEGATLGGEHIQARLTRHSWLDAQHGVEFFASYGMKRMTNWHEFLAVLQKYYEHNPDDYDEIKAGAELAFQSIHDCLEGLNT
ncbi:biliverdin-producing heme oxygenase [Paraglaciecola sp. L1A13]|uniref:biliverdin-producing heme oxygenase n=1 Tax=Paraglaciecola sp. L1A13 TaxID=2686359 RepID=UPI00131E78ED|nr:biliverdin-producing heme oxygenase [Paraglaciecola sp. L1A13]